ncbi:MAG: (2Fe-2S)-binding protein [Mogibacterium sp.]|nr:(2Fe-2S)-binding protein [Mogibacterium sp.]
MIIKINGKECACEKGEYLLTIARRNGITIPTLCQHDAIEEGMGACRLCIAEITDRGRKSVVVSCLYPVTSEIEVETNSERIQRERRMILTLLAKRAPESPEIRQMCKYYKAPDIERFVKIDGEKCVMCGLCAKVCGALSVGAISTVNRGITKAISTPYGDPDSVCIGCGACAKVCPTKAIELKDDFKTRTIWGKTFDLVHCTRCGAVIGTEEQIKKAANRSGNEFDGLCDECRKERMARVMADTFGYEV